jgi:hypothetical protein
LQTPALDNSATGIRTPNPSKRVATGPRLTPRGHQDSNPRPYGL